MISFNYYDFNNAFQLKTKRSWIKNENVDYAADFNDFIADTKLLFNYPNAIKLKNSGEFVGKYFEIGSNLIIDNKEDGDPVFLAFNKSVLLHSGCTIMPKYRCKGLYIFVNGDFVVNGTISMKQRGCKGEGRFVGFDISKKYINHYNICIVHSLTNIFEEKKIKYIDKVGGAGGSGNQTNMGFNGSSTYYCYGENGTSSLTSSGGGGQGGAFSTSTTIKGGSGAAGTSFCGGAGGGQYGSKSGTSNAGGENGGAGGNYYIISSYYGSSYQACGNPNGTAQNGNLTGETGMGGLLCLVVKGTLTINGLITADGSSSLNYSNKAVDASRYSFGGCSGAGNITIFYGKEIKNQSKISCRGGDPYKLIKDNSTPRSKRRWRSDKFN